MEIQCPHCASRFNLPEHLARPGAKVRCSVCKTVFALQLPEPAHAPIPDLLPDDVEQPRPRRPNGLWGRGFCRPDAGTGRTLLGGAFFKAL